MIVAIRNGQRLRRVDTALWRRIIEAALRLLCCHDYEVGFHLVRSREMTGVNRKFLGHEGSTDVITFDHRDTPRTPLSSREPLYGEIFICIDVALTQAEEHQTTWQAELLRYTVHGLLHLEGYDDLTPAVRRVMKRQENLRVTQLESLFTIRRLERRPSHGR